MPIMIKDNAEINATDRLAAELRLRGYKELKEKEEEKAEAPAAPPEDPPKDPEKDQDQEKPDEDPKEDEGEAAPAPKKGSKK